MKNLNTSIKPKRINKPRQPRDFVPTDTDPKSTFAWRAIPVSDAMVNRYVEELYLWVENNPNEKFITKFYMSKGLARQTYFDLIERHDHLREAHNSAMRLMGERMVGNSIDFKANWAPVAKLMHMYAPEFKAVDEHHAKLRIEENQAMGVQTVYLPAFRETKELDEHQNKKAINVKNTPDQ